MRMVASILAGIAAAALAGISPATAIAQQAPPPEQQRCAPLADLIAGLASQYHEQPVARGLNAAGELIVIFAGPQGSWTVLGVRPADPQIGCVVGAGTDWQLARPEVPGTDL